MTIGMSMTTLRASALNSLPAHLAGTELQHDWIQSSSETDSAALYQLLDGAGECKGYLIQEKDENSGEVFNHIHTVEGEYVQELKYLELTINNINDLMQ